MNNDLALLSLTIFLPTAGALLLAFFRDDNPEAVKAMRLFGVAICAVTFGFSLVMLHDASMASRLIRLVSSTSGRLMPSTPSA